MNINEFLNLLINAKLISSHTTLNYIRIDGIVYKLSNAIVEANWHGFSPTQVGKPKYFDYSMSEAKDKVTKKVMDKRVTVNFNDHYNVTLEYNDVALFVVDDVLTENWVNMAQYVVANLSLKNGEFETTNSYIVNNLNQITDNPYVPDSKTDKKV